MVLEYHHGQVYMVSVGIDRSVRLCPAGGTGGWVGTMGVTKRRGANTTKAGSKSCNFR